MSDDYHEIARRQAQDRAEKHAAWQAEKARQAAMKPAELAIHLPVFADPINDPRGD